MATPLVSLETPADGERAVAREDDRTALTKDAFKHAFLDNLFYVQGKFPGLATKNDYYQALAYAVRDRMLRRWISTAAAYTKQGSRTVAYFSAEFLMGPHLGNNLINLGIHDEVRQAITELGLNFDELLQQEDEPGLGNGGLGRLAACFIDSLATLEIPALGYGIRYEFGIFHQEIVEGWQVERTDKWLHFGNPWEIARPEWAVQVKLGGHTEQYRDEQDRLRVRWVPHKLVQGIPYDTPILGYRTNTANTLRLWKAEAPESFDFAVFNRGDYNGAVYQKVSSETLSKVLYPNDEQIQGKELRLGQQYFFVSCSLQDMLRILKVQKIPIEKFHEKFAAQLNDTHPAIAVAELMRLLVDEYVLPWDEAWQITRKTFAYTNHTLLPEALESWPLDLFARVLPRHLEIIFEINARFLDEVRIRFFGDEERLARLSLIDERGERYVRMAHLACVGSHTVNGVAELHSELLKQEVLKDFYELWPERFGNKTNGVTPRRWMVLSNPRLSSLITTSIGEGWIKDLSQLRRLEPLADDASFRQQWREVKRACKVDFAAVALKKTGVTIDPDSLFDVQVKRIHEYKRQHLNILHVIALYHRLRSAPNVEMQPRTFIFGGKAAPGYHIAKLIIRLITAVADVVNRDPAVRDRLKVVFLPNFNVKNGQRVYPAADLSEQISTAGKEASGTGNMKFMLNGTVTLGTYDGANIEIVEQAGKDNNYIFGATVEDIAHVKSSYSPRALYENDARIRRVMDTLVDGTFSDGNTGSFRELYDSILNGASWHAPDHYYILLDLLPYIDAKLMANREYRDSLAFGRKCLLNTVAAGKFSSDRAVKQYASEIWHVASGIK